MSTGLAADAVVKVHRRGDEYVLSIQRCFHPTPFEIPLRNWRARFDSLRESLPADLNDIRRTIGFADLRLSDREVKRAARRLERLGYGLVDHLLEGSGQPAWDVIPRVVEFLAPIFRAKSAEHRPVLELESAAADDPALRFPFEFLPLAPAPAQKYLERDAFEPFLGFRAEIVRSLRGAAVSPREPTTGKLPIHLFAYNGGDLKGVLEQSYYFENNARILGQWPGPSGSVPSVDESIARLAELILDTPRASPVGTLGSVAHFSCHYAAAGDDGESGPVAQPHFNFGKCSDGQDLIIKLMQLRGELTRQQIARHGAALDVLFFLNACESGAGLSQTNTVLGILQDRNAAAILVCETLLPDPLAAKFAIEFYTELIRGAPLGKAVIRARRRLLDLYSNPGGLFYTLFGNPMLTVAKMS